MMASPGSAVIILILLYSLIAVTSAGPHLFGTDRECSTHNVFCFDVQKTGNFSYGKDEKLSNERDTLFSLTVEKEEKGRHKWFFWLHEDLNDHNVTLLLLTKDKPSNLTISLSKRTNDNILMSVKLTGQDIPATSPEFNQLFAESAFDYNTVNLTTTKKLRDELKLESKQIKTVLLTTMDSPVLRNVTTPKYEFLFAAAAHHKPHKPWNPELVTSIFIGLSVTIIIFLIVCIIVTACKNQPYPAANTVSMVAAVPGISEPVVVPVKRSKSRASKKSTGSRKSHPPTTVTLVPEKKSGEPHPPAALATPLPPSKDTIVTPLPDGN
jgi:hypothetical protein